MEVDPGPSLACLESSLGQLYALAVSYSLSVFGAVVLLVIGYTAARLPAQCRTSAFSPRTCGGKTESI
jgi:hypothetical protein